MYLGFSFYKHKWSFLLKYLPLVIQCCIFHAADPRQTYSLAFSAVTGHSKGLTQGINHLRNSWAESDRCQHSQKKKERVREKVVQGHASWECELVDETWARQLRGFPCCVSVPKGKWHFMGRGWTFCTSSLSGVQGRRPLTSCLCLSLSLSLSVSFFFGLRITELVIKGGNKPVRWRRQLGRKYEQQAQGNTTAVGWSHRERRRYRVQPLAAVNKLW